MPSPMGLGLITLTILLSCAFDSSVGALQLQINRRAHHHGRFKSTMSNARPLPIDRSDSVQRMKARDRYTSLSPLFNDQSSSDGNVSGSAAKSGSLLPYIAPWFRAVAIFGVGYGLGGASAPGWQRHSRVSSRIGVTKIALIILILRDVWRSTPTWMKPRITRYGRKAINLFRRSDAQHDVDEIEDGDDITDFSNIATKIQALINVAERKLEIEEKEDFNFQVSFIALIRLIQQVKSKRDSSSARDQIYRSSGTAVPTEMLEGLDHLFELADLAYDEHEDGSIKEVLKGMGYNLIKHDTTAVPGYLGYYMAINSDPSGDKTAIIGIKGTSNFEDFLTDMCASAVEYNLTSPFYKDGSKTLRCHEGVLISSQRLLEDLLPTIKNLLIPSGYKIRIVGHSLGAACATFLAILLRSSIPSLQNEDLLKVWAFASNPVLDLNSALACSSFVTTVVNNCDVVPRANISPLVVTMEMLRAVNKRLKEQNSDVSTIEYLYQLYDGKDGEMLMSADDIYVELDNALKRAELEDPDHLYVPGQVVLMYNLWEKEQQQKLSQEDQEEEDTQKDFSTVLKGWIMTMKDMNMHSDVSVDLQNIPRAEEVILCDGTCKALRFIEFDGRLLDDHMAPPYRSSISNILSLRNTKEQHLETEA